MKTLSFCMGILALTSGCAQRTYEIDLSRVNGFDWDGKLRVRKTQEIHIGPFLTFDPVWTTSRVELLSRDGRRAVIETGGGDETPQAHVGLKQSMPMELVEAENFWNLGRPIVLADPAMVAQALRIAATQPAASQPAVALRMWQPPEKMRPYSEHVSDMGLVDWWAVALSESNEVSLDFAGPDGLHILMRGNPHRHGPAVLEVRDREGQVLAKFEQEQLTVKPVDH